MRIWRGAPYPLGATWDGEGTNFALFSENATGVELCLFDEDGRERRVTLPERTDHVWHAYLPDIGPGQRYGYRVAGPWAPADGHRFNPAKLLLDPYARRVVGHVDATALQVGHQVDADGRPMPDPDERDSAPEMPRGVVVDSAFDWGDDRQLRTAWEGTVIYEVHVKGFTQRHPDVPEELRGRYGGLASDPAIEHLQRLGVTAVELMPVHQHVNERHLVERGLTNYWGYNTIGFFAPDQRFAAGDEPVVEFKAMVRRLHAAGIEVILDVVYNHTAEGDHQGPTLSFRGIDNAAYYRLDPERPQPLRGLHGHRQHPERGPSPHAAADHGQPSLLDHRDARRRLPLRPGLGAGARAARRRQAGVLLRHRPPGPADQPGQAHRRAVGPGRGRLPGRQLPDRLGRVEWPLPRPGSPLLARHRRAGGGARLPADRLIGPLCGGRTAAARQHQLRHRPRRLHAGRPGQLRAQAQRGERRGQPRRRRPQRVAQLRRRGPDQRPGGAGGASAAAAQLARHPAAQPGRADAAGRRRDGPQPGRQQQRLCPGQPHQLVRLGPDR